VKLAVPICISIQTLPARTLPSGSAVSAQFGLNNLVKTLALLL
jgi:hypothetical protein